MTHDKRKPTPEVVRYVIDAEPDDRSAETRITITPITVTSTVSWLDPFNNFQFPQP